MNSSPFYNSRLLIFLALLFSTSLVQPSCTHTFNPLLYIQDHKIESVFRGTNHYFKANFLPGTEERTTSSERSSSTRSYSSNGIITTSWLSKHYFCSPSPLLSNSYNTTFPQVFNHIRFIKHQSFSDAPQNLVLI